MCHTCLRKIIVVLAASGRRVKQNTYSSANLIFARAVVRERRIPFEIQAPRKEYSKEGALKAMKEMRDASARKGTSDMTLQEINAEIDAVRRDE